MKVLLLISLKSISQVLSFGLLQFNFTHTHKTNTHKQAHTLTLSTLLQIGTTPYLQMHNVSMDLYDAVTRPDSQMFSTPPTTVKNKHPEAPRKSKPTPRRVSSANSSAAASTSPTHPPPCFSLPKASGAAKNK